MYDSRFSCKSTLSFIKFYLCTKRIDTSGSIIAEMTFVGLPEELKAVIQAIHNHILNDGNIFIGGMPVQILNFISDNILGILHH